MRGKNAESLLRAILKIGLLICLCSTTLAQPVDYSSQVKPLLAEKCYSCHGRLKQESGLRLETRSLMLEGGALVAGDADNSELLRRVTDDGDLRMPPQDQGAALKPDEIDLLRRWIEQGAAAPEEPIPGSPSDHWAFQPITRPTVPLSPSGSTCPHPVDAFLQAKHETLQLQTTRPADRRLRLRRLYLDLIGLPPTLSQLRDPRPWADIVDDLLASPQHGERWARHWMDVWRYSDWYGLGAQLRYSQKHIWHWRDWILASLNSDKGYDRMIQEMLAADEIAPLDDDALRATGFLARNYYLFNRTTWLDSTIEHTSKAFLGLTVNCAKCHDHKYDPITQYDYYRLRAIFEPHQVRLDPLAGKLDFEVNGLPRVFDDQPDLPTFVHLRGDPKTPDSDTVVKPGVPSFLVDHQPAIEPIELPYQAYAPGLREAVLATQKREAMEVLQEAKQLADTDPSPRSQARLHLAEAKLATLLATASADAAVYRDRCDAETCRTLALVAAVCQAEEKAAAAELRLLEVGDDAKQQQSAQDQLKAAEKTLQAARRGELAYEPIRGSKKALESPAHKESDYPAVYGKTSTGRRRALAAWITAPNNPLTARVAVNHVWLRHFGQPLVESMFDFGLRTPRPAHAELLDFLATEFMQSGWSFRHLHRLIVTSQTYQRTSSSTDADPATLQQDRDNQFYWRMNSTRMQSQVVRDSLLHLAGKLDTTVGGPSVDANGDSRRRSLYFKHSRDDQNRLLKMFDDADLMQCYRRKVSIVPQQALALANGDLSLSLAADIADRIAENCDPSPSADSVAGVSHTFIRTAFEFILARLPTDDELAVCREYLDDLAALPDAPDPPRMRRRLVHALLNHNDFITIR